MTHEQSILALLMLAAVLLAGSVALAQYNRRREGGPHIAFTLMSLLYAIGGVELVLIALVYA